MHMHARNFSTHHTMIEDSIGYRLSCCVLGIQSLAHDVNVGLLPHLTGREHTKLDVATAEVRNIIFLSQDARRNFKRTHIRLTFSWRRLCLCIAPSWWRMETFDVAVQRKVRTNRDKRKSTCPGGR